MRFSGGPCTWKSQAVVLLAGTWCLAAFVLVNSYSSTLITYVIAHENRPLISSIHDIGNSPHINVIVKKGHILDDYFTVSTLEQFRILSMNNHQ